MAGQLWPKSHSDRLREDFLAGMPRRDIVDDINARFGASYSLDAVKQRARRLGLQWRTPTTSGWPQEHKDLLKECLEKGMSRLKAAVEINERFGTSYSRNACISQAARLGLAKVQPVQTQSARTPIKTRTKPLPRTTTQFLKKNASQVLADLPPAGAKDSCDEGAERDARSIIELGPNDCKWPSASDPVTFCCAWPRLPGFPYCGAHLERSLRVYAARAVA